ncbi:unnamed protein product [Protopolystoma xenopodis]|uniref:Uncharacterized protein n=1 Tax=Protopolystoma xenopodis TaxID=117903 RepID=A0A448WJP9_9PLAT|nr:unnamed protein product [Protopolystoma xenopodis]
MLVHFRLSRIPVVRVGRNHEFSGVHHRLQPASNCLHLVEPGPGQCSVGVIRPEGPTQADRLHAAGHIKPLDPENRAARRTSAMGNGYIALLTLGMAPN